jgi:hypothetical protein
MQPRRRYNAYNYPSFKKSLLYQTSNLNAREKGNLKIRLKPIISNLGMISFVAQGTIFYLEVKHFCNL